MAKQVLPSNINRSIILCLFLMVISLPAWSKPSLLVVGDSLSAAYQIPPEQGWVKLLENKLKKSYPDITVINSSIVGDTSSNGLERLPPLLTQYQPDFVIIELGGNDGLRGLPIANIKANLSSMINLSLGANAKVLLIGMRLPPNYGTTYTDQFAKIYTDLSAKFEIALVPFLLDKVATNPQLMFPDHVHPIASAQPLLLDNVFTYLQPLLPPAP